MRVLLVDLRLQLENRMSILTPDMSTMSIAEAGQNDKVIID